MINSSNKVKYLTNSLAILKNFCIEINKNILVDDLNEAGPIVITSKEYAKHHSILNINDPPGSIFIIRQLTKSTKKFEHYIPCTSLGFNKLRLQNILRQ